MGVVEAAGGSADANGQAPAELGDEIEETVEKLVGGGASGGDQAEALGAGAAGLVGGLEDLIVGEGGGAGEGCVIAGGLGAEGAIFGAAAEGERGNGTEADGGAIASDANAICPIEEVVKVEAGEGGEQVGLWLIELAAGEHGLGDLLDLGVHVRRVFGLIYRRGTVGVGVRRSWVVRSKPSRRSIWRRLRS